MQTALGTTWPFYISLAFRLLVALTTRTFFQPDEFYQALEPAHYAVFGYGALTWEWTLRPPLRSFAYPSLFVPVYWIVKVMGLEDTPWMVHLPKLLQGLIASASDYYSYRLAVRALGPRYGNAALFLSLASFFNALSLTRTLSNSTETSISAAALYYWPIVSIPDGSNSKSSFRSRFRLALFLSGLACMTRPSAAVMWAFLFLCTFWDLRQHRRSILPYVTDSAVIGLAVLGFLLGIDSLYYQKITLTPLVFLTQNFLSSNPISEFYGRNPFHYYITQGLPILLATSLPFALHGIYTTIKGPSNVLMRRLLSLTSWTMVVFSLAKHKEWRFLHPLLPGLLVMASKSLVDCYEKAGNRGGRATWAPIASRRLRILPRHLYLLLVPVPVIFYVVLCHGRAQVDVMHYLRSLNAEIQSLGFLMPCHSTPWQAYLHRPQLEGRMWALTCQPPIGLQGTSLLAYRDQADVFYDSPCSYLLQRFPSDVDPTFPVSTMPMSPADVPTQLQNWTHAWPSHLVFFGALMDEPCVRDVLEERGYAEAWTARNGWEEDPRRRGGVRVWRWNEGDRMTDVMS